MLYYLKVKTVLLQLFRFNLWKRRIVEDMLVRQQVTCHLSYTYFIYLYTVKSSVYITIKSFITITLFYKIAVWGLDRELRYSWSISLLKYPKGSDFRKLMGKLFHSSAPFLLGHRRALRALEHSFHGITPICILYCTCTFLLSQVSVNFCMRPFTKV